MPRLSRLLRDEGVPVCPICDGPCTHDFPKGDAVFPDRLPKAKDGSADPKPEPIRRSKRRGRRAHHAPENDRMRRPDEDRGR